MIPNNNLSVLPFYESVEKQNHRKDYAFGEIFPLFTPDKRVLPFQIIRPHRANGIVGAWLYDLTEHSIADITIPLKDSGLAIHSYGANGYDVITYHGQLPLSIDTPEGRYYIHMTDGVQNWYSEVFTIVRFVDSYLKIAYRDFANLQFDSGLIDFTNGFKFNIYLPTQVGRPDYEFEEAVDKRDGYQFVEKQISEKTYKFNFLAPEYLLDAMRIIRMMDEVVITCKGDTYAVDQFLMTPKWQDGGYLAAVEVEFQCNTILKKIGRGMASTGVDFDNSFNNDFKTT